MPLIFVIGLLLWNDRRSQGSGRLGRLTEIKTYKDDIAHIADSFSSDGMSLCVFLGGSVAYAMAIAPVAAFSLPAYLATATLGPIILFCLPVTDLLARNTRFYLYRPNPYIDMYDDPQSRNWLRPATAQRITEPAEANLLPTR